MIKGARGDWRGTALVGQLQTLSDDDGFQLALLRLQSAHVCARLVYLRRCGLQLVFKDAQTLKYTRGDKDMDKDMKIGMHRGSMIDVLMSIVVSAYAYLRCVNHLRCDGRLHAVNAPLQLFDAPCLLLGHGGGLLQPSRVLGP